MDRTLRAYLAELIGTFTLVFLIAAMICATQIPLPEDQPVVGLVGVAVAQGCILAALLTATTLVSEGCLNPAITLTLWVTRRFEGRRMLGLIGVQLLGAVLAGGLVAMVFGDEVLRRAHAGTPHLGNYFRENGDQVTASSLFAGIAIEAGLTFLLTLSILATVLHPHRQRFGGLIAGVAQTGCVLVGYHLTGAATNPARWFGPAIWQQAVPALKGERLFADHAVYWMGPILGALLAGMVYTGVIVPPDKKE